MSPEKHTYELFAELLEYPATPPAEAARLCAERVSGRSLAAATAMLLFERRVKETSAKEAEERYASVFDFSPARTLDLGYQLFGETYKRGVFLVKMKQVTSAHGIDAGCELADHLPVVLRLLAVLTPKEEPKELADEVILPSVEKILRTFEGEGEGYRWVLEALKATLMSDFGIDHVELPRTAEAPVETGGKRLPMFPGFHPPSEGTLS